VRNVDHLPGIVGYSIAMPDIHWGYGFPIGGVAAVDAETGVISPGGVGYDINCGVRMAILSHPFDSFSEKQKKALLDAVYRNVPSGVGEGRKDAKSLTAKDYRELTQKGARWSVEQGYGFARDLDLCESHGVIPNASMDHVSQEAQKRGSQQLGTIGSGNHFVEIGKVEKLLLEDVAHKWGINQGDTYVLIHTGSRGFGHQVCQDALDLFFREGCAKDLPDKQLVAAPLKSALGQHYFSSMCAAANYAFNNRQQILHFVRKAFQEALKIPEESIRLIYDVCHNIAKIEKYLVDGKEKELCVHRKGATRAFGAGASELPPIYKETGQPVLVPGDMGRASYLMVGDGNPLTWCSACHGAGRARSRHKSADAWRHEDPEAYMRSKGVDVRAKSMRTIVEEMPDAYKNVDDVVEAVQQAGLARMVARLKPKLVVKG
jgi:tRNA-splicing ligase RtcB